MQPTSLLSFRRKFHSYDSNSLTGPVVVHCSAGVGRSGTFIALDYLIEQAKSEGQVDVLGCVYKLRQSRVNMVQTPASDYLLITKITLVNLHHLIVPQCLYGVFPLS